MQKLIYVFQNDWKRNETVIHGNQQNEIIRIIAFILHRDITKNI